MEQAGIVRWQLEFGFATVSSLGGGTSTKFRENGVALFDSAPFVDT